jgi:hypothetical protein
MCWNLFAYFAERAWSGINTPSNFEERFRSIFYGAPLPILDNVIKLADKLQLKPDEYWRMHRINAQGYTRLVKAKPELINEARHDEQLLFDAVQTVSACKRDAVREAEHLDHFTVALQRMATVTKRILFAAGDEKDVNTVIRTLAESCSNYQKVWLRNNKTENIEVSLRVFENAIASYNQANDIKDADKYLPVDLSDYYNFNSQEVCGLPIGGETLNGIPFKFAGNNKTQLNLGEIGTRTTISLPANKIRDLHMIITCPKPAAEKPAPGIRVELLKDENVVFTEELLLIAHLCDWWAPLGEHTWAGGGYRYADKNRVRYALSPNACFGLCEVFNFNLPDSEADKVRFTPLADNRAAIFALTLEKS